MSQRFFVGTRKGLFTIEVRPSGDRIVAVDFLGDPVSAVLHDPRDGALYVALHHGHFGPKLHVRRSGATSFEELPVPEYPEKPADVVDIDPMTQTPRAWKLGMIWCLEAGLASEPGRLYVGTLPGGLFRSDDGGRSFELARGLWDHPSRALWFGGGVETNQPGMHSILVDPARPGRVLVAISCGGVWETTDGGQTFAPRTQGMRAAYTPPEQAFEPAVQDPHRMAWNPHAPDVLWVQHHNGIFVSEDGGRAWREVEAAGPSTFGFTVAAHPKRPKTAWFIPAIKDERRIPEGGRLVVTRTDDGGRSFRVITAGLPQEHAYDIVLRHALDVDATGDTLAFGSTTGNLFTSTDSGERWRCASAHLPPIYVVRAATN